MAASIDNVAVGSNILGILRIQRHNRIRQLNDPQGVAIPPPLRAYCSKARRGGLAWSSGRPWLQEYLTRRQGLESPSGSLHNQAPAEACCSLNTESLPAQGLEAPPECPH